MSVKVYLEKSHLVDMACGRRVPYGGTKLTKFIGNQWDEEWAWDRSKIEELTEKELCEMLGLVNLQIAVDVRGDR